MGVEERDRHAWLRLTSVSEKDTLERESRKIDSITPPHIQFVGVVSMPWV
jgi:hypothetical protein